MNQISLNEKNIKLITRIAACFAFFSGLGGGVNCPSRCACGPGALKTQKARGRARALRLTVQHAVMIQVTHVHVRAHTPHRVQGGDVLCALALCTYERHKKAAPGLA